MRPALTISVAFFLLIALLHILRLIFAVVVTVDGKVIPMWVSVPASIAAALLAVWLWRSQRTAP